MTSEKKIVIFIDGSNFNGSFRQCNFRPNYEKITKLFAEEGDVIGQYYFTALPPPNVETKLRNVMDHITYHGWKVVSKETKEFDGVVKGNMDVEIVVQAWTMWEHFTDLILFSGDGDFAPMVSELQRRGRRVTCVSLHKPGDAGNSVADELRRCVNKFIDLREIRDRIMMDDTIRLPVPREPVLVPVPAPVKRTLTFLRGR